MTTAVGAPIEDTFMFFTKAGNLGMLCPAALRFRTDGPIPALGEGVRINYRIRVGGLPFRWRTRIVSWNPPHDFIDVQDAGPYRMWRHEHRFTAQEGRTIMEDRVSYAPPLRMISWLVNRWFVAPRLRDIFRYRADIIRLRFGA